MFESPLDFCFALWYYRDNKGDMTMAQFTKKERKPMRIEEVPGKGFYLKDAQPFIYISPEDYQDEEKRKLTKNLRARVSAYKETEKFPIQLEWLKWDRDARGNFIKDKNPAGEILYVAAKKGKEYSKGSGYYLVASDLSLKLIEKEQVEECLKKSLPPKQQDAAAQDIPDEVLDEGDDQF
jgi:hypothetical protein